MTYEGITAEYFDQRREARADLGYLALSLDPGGSPVVLLHHTPSLDDWYRKITRRLGHHGYRRSAINSPPRGRGQSR
jgi:hypothetical protein